RTTRAAPASATDPSKAARLGRYEVRRLTLDGGFARFSNHSPIPERKNSLMSANINELLGTTQVGDPQGAGDLQVFGLHWQAVPGPLYATLEEAIAAKVLEITEISEGGSVPLLRAVNSSDRMVFLMAGEQLVGAKQNRVLNASIMVPPQSTLSIPVSCVEAGRWRYRTPKFAGSDTMSHGLLRKLMAFGIHKSYRREGTPTSDQSEVWAEVSRKLHGMGANSPSSELHQ